MAPSATRPHGFAKALNVDHVRDGEVMLAYLMNGRDLPFLNGFPLRLVVPGYYGTYWVKHLNEITVQRYRGRATQARRKNFEGFRVRRRHGYQECRVSVDGGNTWKGTRLGRNYGRYAFREWKTPVRLSAGPDELKVRATSNGGEVQPAEATWNPAGYMRNVTETVRVTVS